MGTITKALDLLGYFSRSRPDIGLTDFVRLSGRDKATVHRHLTELQENGFLDQDMITRSYRLGPAILRLAAVREATNPFQTMIRPIVVRLANEVGELCHASLLQDDVLSPVCHFDPALHGTQVHFHESELLPLHATSSGLAVLAFGPQNLRDRVLGTQLNAYTSATITDPTFLEEKIDDARASGIASLDRAFDEEVTSQGAAIFDASGTVLGALSVAVPTVRATTERLEKIRKELISAAIAASNSLGGVLPQDHPFHT